MIRLIMTSRQVRIMVWVEGNRFCLEFWIIAYITVGLYLRLVQFIILNDTLFNDVTVSRRPKRAISGPS